MKGNEEIRYFVPSSVLLLLTMLALGQTDLHRDRLESYRRVKPALQKDRTQRQIREERQ